MWETSCKRVTIALGITPGQAAPLRCTAEHLQARSCGGVDSPASALAGAADILAERISENAEVREAARKVAWKTGRLVTTPVDAADKSKEAFRNYFEFSQPVESLPPHRTLGLNRAENEQAIRVKFTWDTDRALGDLETRLALRTHRFQSFLRFQCGILPF